MSTVIGTCAVRLALVTACTLGSAASAAASAILVSNVQVQLDLDLSIASVRADLAAQGNAFLDGLVVSVFQDGEDVSAAIVDDLPFFTNVPPTMLEGDMLADLLLFNLREVMPGASYVVSFYLIEGLNALHEPQGFVFRVPPASVPEPATLLLTATGLAAAGLLRRRRARAACARRSAAPRCRPESRR